MKIIYFSNEHYPVLLIAGAVQSGLLPEEGKLKPANMDMLWEIWRKIKEKNILYLGADVKGNHIFVLHYNCEAGLAEKLVESFLAMYNVKPGEYRFVSMEKKECLLLKLGRLCEKMGLKKIERVLVQSFVQKIYPQMVMLAKH